MCARRSCRSTDGVPMAFDLGDVRCSLKRVYLLRRDRVLAKLGVGPAVKKEHETHDTAGIVEAIHRPGVRHRRH
jgi:hypothetical protein